MSGEEDHKKSKRRKELISRIEEMRGSSIICYLTSLRRGVGAAMADDQVRVIFKHLQKLPKKKVKQIDVFIASHGGSSTVPWRIIALLREFAEKIGVLIPYRAYSAATMLALGADEIVMHPFGEMGPIDPDVSNAFNPTDAYGRLLEISVEDVRAYISFIKDTVGIRRDEELIKAVEILSRKIHPLALGNVERFLQQSRMISKKIIRTHMDDDEHVINDIVENLASKLYYHGHPINRKEAREELKLKVAQEVSSDLEDVMWELYEIYESEFENDKSLLIEEGLFAKIAMRRTPMDENIEATTHDILMAAIDSARLSSRYTTKTLSIPVGNDDNFVVRREVVETGWRHLSL